jgi:hypothetical protein
MNKSQTAGAVITGALLMVANPAHSRFVDTSFNHTSFNASKVAKVQMCKPDFMLVKKTGEQEAVILKNVVTDSKTITQLHKDAKQDYCLVPHVTGMGPRLCVLAYLDKEGKPLALVELWPDGIYYIYDGYLNKWGKICKGHGGCSCGKSVALAQSALKLLKSQHSEEKSPREHKTER